MLHSVRMTLGRTRFALAKLIRSRFSMAKDWLGLGPRWTVVISYPKTGRTWLRSLISKALIDHYDLDAELFLNTAVLSKRAGIDEIFFTHDETHLGLVIPYQRLMKWKGHYRHQRVMFLIRNPYDVMVSSYFQATRRRTVFDGSISDFIRSEHYGIRKYLQFVSIWYRARGVPKDFLLLVYEDLHTHPDQVLRQVLDFAHANEVTDEEIAVAVAFSSFNNLRQLEKEGKVDSTILQPSDSTDTESFKVRRGVVEGYHEYLSEEDIAYIGAQIAAFACPFLDRYASTPPA